MEDRFFKFSIVFIKYFSGGGEGGGLDKYCKFPLEFSLWRIFVNFLDNPGTAGAEGGNVMHAPCKINS